MSNTQAVKSAMNLPDKLGVVPDFSIFFFFSSRRRHTRSDRDWSSDVCSSDLGDLKLMAAIGAFIGLKLTMLTIFLGAFTGAFIGGAFIFFAKDRDSAYELPFGDRKSVV